jgi:hypothetical protein
MVSWWKLILVQIEFQYLSNGVVVVICIVVAKGIVATRVVVAGVTTMGVGEELQQQELQ